jgi:O-antigen ligase
MKSKTGIVIIIAAALIGPICGLDPLGLAPLLHALGLFSLIAYRIDHDRWPIPDRALTIAVCMLLAWIAASCFWAEAKNAAWDKLPELIAIAASALIVPVAIRDMPLAYAAKAQRTLLISLAVGLALMLGDIALGNPIKHMYKPWPIIPINAYDREIVCFSLFVWPVALVIFNKRLRCSSIILLVVSTVATLFSQSHSAMVGMLLGLGVFALGWIVPKIIARSLSAISAIGFAAAVPLGLAMRRWGLDQNPKLQFSFRHRIQIWHFTAERVLHWPLRGLGLEGSRAIPTADLAPGFLPLGNDVPALHPHDMFLQIWLELGGIGAIAALYFMIRLFEATGKQTAPAKIFGLAAAAAALAIASFAFGIWQGWWLSCLALLASMIVLAKRNGETP